ncbi:MAG: hypothetical protein H6573_36195 [Lewinellaceae bacterium]|nr:hypothetical protein [Lewinellaceae bacterium]MCB9352467.1 hypothetical protein [Lewinellaceae bacterium]MCB9352887.1 hypothetical protein [Lewinellaceae bacterium]
MKDLEIMDERISKVADLLEQIKSVDEMIDLHKQKGDEEDIMLIQYQYRRGKFLKELSSILEDLNIRPTDLAA